MKFIVLFVLTVLMIACTSSKKSKKSPLNNIESQEEVLITNLQSQIIQLDAELMKLNVLITNAQARKQLQAEDPTNNDTAMIDTELINFEIKKQSIISQKSMLQSQIGTSK